MDPPQRVHERFASVEENLAKRSRIAVKTPVEPVTTLPVRVLNLRDAKLTLNDFRSVASYKDLKRLSVQKCKVDSAAFEILAQLTQLQELVWEENRDADSLPIALAAIARLTLLTELSIANNGLNDKQIEPLSRLNNLAVLDLSNNNLNGSGLIHLATLKRLTSLDVLECDLSKETPFHAMTSLQKLCLSTTDRVLPAISTLSNLTALRCETDIDEPDDLENVGKMIALTSLNLIGTHFNLVEHESFMHLTKLTRLCSLYLLEIHIRDDKYLWGVHALALTAAIANITTLKTLAITLGCFNRPIALNLAQVTGVTSLRLNLINQSVEPIRSLRFLTRITQLNKLGLADLRVTKPDARLFRGLPLFRKLVLQDCTITSQAKPLLQKLQKVKEINERGEAD